MVDDSICDLTLLQRQIIHTVARSSGSVNNIAEILDCSESYVRSIKREYAQRIEYANELLNINHLPLFSKPYSILFQEDSLEHLSLCEGDLLELTCSYEGETETTYGKVETIESNFFAKEKRARVTGAYFTAQGLNASSDDLFSDIQTLSNGRANPESNDEFRSLIQCVQKSFNDSIAAHEPEVLIGAGILEVIHGQRDPTDVISTPYFTFEEEYFVKYLSNNFPEIDSLRLVTEEPQEPEEAYFTCYGERLTESQQAKLQTELLNQEYFKASWNYAQPGTGSFVGPTSTDVTTDVIRVTPESIRIVPGVTQSVRFYEDDGSLATNLDVDTVYEAIQNAEPEFEMLKATRGRVDSEFPIRRDGQSLSFLFDQVTLVLTPRGDSIEWQRPAEVAKLETFISAVNEMIKLQLELGSINVAEAKKPQYTRVEDERWAFDTNALYHDHVGDKPSTILHTVMAHPFFEGTTIHIPWAVLFEFNKHADPGEGTNRANRQGFENLAILKTLDQLDYLNVSIQNLPKKVNSGLNIGDIADIYMLAHAAEVDARLITGDHALEELGHLADVPVVNVTDLKTYSAPVEGSSPEEEILPRIGMELNTETEIIQAIESLINTDSVLPVSEGSRPSPFDPDSIINSWCSREELIAFYNRAVDEVCYAHRCDMTLIPTSGVISQLVEYTDESSNLLTNQLKDQLETDASDFPIGSNEFPFIHLHVPLEYIVGQAKPGDNPSDFNTLLLKLRGLENLNYDAKSAQKIQSDIFEQAIDNSDNDGTVENFLTAEDYVAVCLAISTKDAILLIDENQTGLWKFSRLFGVEALRLTSQPN